MSFNISSQFLKKKKKVSNVGNWAPHDSKFHPQTRGPGSRHRGVRGGRRSPCWHSAWQAAATPSSRGSRRVGSGQEGWAGLTFTLPAFPLVAGLAQASVGLGRVLTDGIDVAVVRALRALVHVDWPCAGEEGERW